MRAGIVGLGEAGAAIAKALRDTGRAVACFDGRPVSGTAARAAAMGLDFHATPDGFASACDVVLVTVQSSQAQAAAGRLLPHLGVDHLLADHTAKSVAVRDDIARLCAEKSVAFCDVAIADTVSWPDRTADLLVSGAGTDRLVELYRGTRFLVRVVNSKKPVSAELKLMRSVFTKGLAALLLETLTAAELCDARAEIQRSIGMTMREDFSRIAEMLVGSSIKHAARRAHEMRDSRCMMEGALGGAPMTAATSRLLDAIAGADVDVKTDTLDAVIAQMVNDRVFQTLAGARGATH